VTDEVLDKLAAAPPRRVLEDLARIGHALAKHDRARPEVELYLASGQSVRGRVLRVADGMALLVSPPAASAVGSVLGTEKRASRGRANQEVIGSAVTFVVIDQIVALSVADASLLVKAPTSDAPVPSRLELQRQAASRGDALELPMHLGGASELDDDGRRAIGVTLPLVADVLAAIASDAMGKEALATIESVEIGAAASGDVQLTGKRLVVRAPTLLADQFTHQALRRAIEKLL